jgi:hypothetical protein
MEAMFCRDQQPHSGWLCDLPPNHQGVHHNAAMSLSWANAGNSTEVGCQSVYRGVPCSLPKHRGTHRSTNSEWVWNEDGTEAIHEPARALYRPTEVMVAAPGDWMAMGSEEKANADNKAVGPRSRAQRKRRH